MEIEANLPYSPTTVYGQLTSPFTTKQITINAHTPYDKADENIQAESKVYSREYFEGKPVAKMKFELPKQEVQTSKQNFTPTINNEENETEQSKLEIASFSASSISNKDIVSNMLKTGYTTEEAIVVQKAKDAYKKSLILTDDPAGTLSSCAYKVS